MIGFILKFLAGGGLSAITGDLRKAYEARLAAQNDAERITAEQNIAQLEARQAVLIAEQGRWLTAWIRPGIAAPFVVYLWKLVIWDKVLGWGATDDLSPALWQVMMVIIGAYFLTRPFERR